jgi:hypothetical protein
MLFALKRLTLATRMRLLAADLRLVHRMFSGMSFIRPTAKALAAEAPLSACCESELLLPIIESNIFVPILIIPHQKVKQPQKQRDLQQRAAGEGKDICQKRGSSSLYSMKIKRL